MSYQRSRHTASLLLVAATIVACPRVAVASTFIVSSTLDAVEALPGNGVCATAAGACTLRAAVQEARGLGGAHVITLPAGIYLFTIAGRGELNAATGDLNLIADLTINGAGAATTIIDANGLDRVFNNSLSALTLNDLTVQNGNPGNSEGGCIFASEGDLTLTRVIVKSCHAEGGGGGIYVLGRLFAPPQTTVTPNRHDDFAKRGDGHGWRRRSPPQQSHDSDDDPRDDLGQLGGFRRGHQIV